MGSGQDGGAEEQVARKDVDCMPRTVYNGIGCSPANSSPTCSREATTECNDSGRKRNSENAL